MEVDSSPDPSEINSVDFRKVLHNNIVRSNKKRKLQAEQLGWPLPKHKCSERSLTYECDFPSTTNLEVDDIKNLELDDIKAYILRESDGGARDEDSEPESRKDSNSLPGDTDTAISMSVEANVDLECAKMCPYDWPTTPYMNWGGKSTPYSLDGRTTTQLKDKVELPNVGIEHTSSHHNTSQQIPLNFEDHFLEFGNPVDYSFSECKSDGIEECADKEIESLLYASGINPNNYVLSSGRWSVNQEAQSEKKKLTIDKEFEQYFSMLML